MNPCKESSAFQTDQQWRQEAGPTEVKLYTFDLTSQDPNLLTRNCNHTNYMMEPPMNVQSQPSKLNLSMALKLGPTTPSRTRYSQFHVQPPRNFESFHPTVCRLLQSPLFRNFWQRKENYSPPPLLLKLFFFHHLTCKQ